MGGQYLPMDSATLRGANVMVTGATGFIGSHLVERLVAEGACVRCLVRPVSGRVGVERRWLPEGTTPVLGDLITGEGLAKAVGGASLVFHLAGVTKALHTSEYYSGNAKATENLLRAMASSDARLIHVS